MSLSPATIDALIAAGVTAEQLGAAMKAEMAAEAEREARQIPWPKLRAMAFARDGHRCGYCGCTEGPFEVDHVKPRAQGGEDVLENVVIACAPCNRSKRDRDPEQWSDARERKERDRVRKARKRAEVRGLSADTMDMSADNKDRSADMPDGSADPSLDKESSPEPPQRKLNPPGDISTPAHEEPVRTAVLAEARDTQRAFESFWAAYPRKVAKPEGLKAFFRALKRITGPDPPSVIMTGLQAHLPVWAETEPGFVPNPSTWLNQDRFNDRPEPRLLISAES